VEFYFAASSGRKSVWTLVRQLRGSWISARFIFLLKSKSELSRDGCGSRKPACQLLGLVMP
jgi:hypothetical protein